MKILRIINIQTIDSSNIDLTFTENITDNLITSNITISSDTFNVPDAEVLSIKISNNVLSITCQLLTPLADYLVILKSVDSHPFISVNGDAIISEDGISNQILITGPLDADNPVRNFFESYFKENIYNLDDPNTLISKYIDSLSVNLSKALYDIGQVKNENYLSFTILDEKHTRGSGPFDRLNEESAYEIIRVGATPTSDNSSDTFSLDNFPAYPVTLQRQIVSSEEFHSNSSDQIGAFNINTLTFNFPNSPITRINSIIFTLLTNDPIYVYNIEKFGYQIKNSRYDQDFSFSYDLLNDNQIRISDKILSDPLFSLDKIFKINISYEYKNLGINVDSNSVIVNTIFKSIRETLPPIINIFNLRKAPIVDSNNNIFTLGGVTFTDPNTPGTPHPAFTSEIPFRLSALPFMIGQYSIDYSTGTVYVFGADLTNDGTGPFPPLATYNYRFVFKSEQDYVYDSDLLDLVSLPNGNLTNEQGTVTFSFEQAFIPGTDYISNLHQESLSERINNNLLALNVLKVNNSPITSVFRVYNETAGEIYTVTRWNDDKVYFSFNNPPRLNPQTGERASFLEVNNELLFVNTTLNNINNLQIFKIFLANNTLVSGTQDSIGSSFNSSAFFSNNNVFISERWFNREFTEIENTNRLRSVGEYLIDYVNGIVYCAVSINQSFDIGTISYKDNFIVPRFPHLISVDDIYYQISPLTNKNKHFTYISFGDGFIQPQAPDFSDELFLNNNSLGPYQILNGSVGIFTDSSFVEGVTSQIKFVRSIFEYQDLLNNINPINFAISSISSGFNISINPIDKISSDNVKFDGTHFYVNIAENISYLSPNIAYNFSVIRNSDSKQLWNSSGVIVTGNMLKLILPGINSPVIGDSVTINYSFTIDNISRIAVDYNKGDYFVDYTYLADEIIVSYEFGDNIIDFRTSKTVSPNTDYYVSYKVGALRDALLKNFGTLVNVPILANVDLDFDRERYRDALTAALTSFIQGPTLTAIKNIGRTISHIEPEVVESAFQEWSLGSSLLNPQPINTSGSFQLLPGKYGNGVLVNNSNQSITFPASSNVRFEEGTFESWIIPQWNGIDNDAILTFTILKNNTSIDPLFIFVGSSEKHPVLHGNGNLILDKNSDVIGTPNKNKDGIFIYYDKDISGNFNRWYVEVIDGYTEGGGNVYNFKISSTGFFYDSKSLILPKPSNLTIFTGTNSLSFNISSNPKIDEGITFISDVNHYLLDLGEDKSKNRISIFKDSSGYLNLRVLDKNKVGYYISSDVSFWKIGDSHHVAASWKLNTRNSRDELHLFIDGIEVPNIIRYGQKLQPFLHEKFRTVNPEEIIGSPTRDIVGSIDLQTIAGTNSVTSSINFSALNIFVGDTIFIDEIGFNSSGYTINSINGQTLILNAAMPITLNDGRFSINRTTFTTISEISNYPNIYVTTISPSITGHDLFGSLNSNVITSVGTNFSVDVSPGYSIRIDNISLNAIYTILQVSGNSLTLDSNLAIGFSGNTFHIYPSNSEVEIPGVRALQPSYSIDEESITISNNVFAADLILIRTLGINSRKIKKDYYIWSDGYENTLMTQLSPPISLNDASVMKVILANTVIGPSNSTLSGQTFTSSNLITYQPSNTQVGRLIEVTLSGTNVDFSTSTQITINGVSNFITVSETISFTDYGILNFNNLYTSINYIRVVSKVNNTAKNACAILVREKKPITQMELNEIVPIIRFSYEIGKGTTLKNDVSFSVRDENNLFSSLDIDNFLIIKSPSPVAGSYKIEGISSDRKSLKLTGASLPNFSNGVYQILNATAYRSGLQNGFFTFEDGAFPGKPYFLSHGFYHLEYLTYIDIKLDPFSQENNIVHLGSDFNSENQINSIIDEVKISSVMLNDTRIGESVPSNQESITKDFNSLKALTSSATTLVLINFDTFPFVNSASFFTMSEPIQNHFQSSIVINENFGNSSVFLNKPLIISNEGILDTKKEGSIEFWINPLFDTGNDPNNRYYFDAFGAVLTEATSINNVSVKISAPASEILSVKLKNGDPSINYFVGGKLEIDTQRAIVEETISLANNSVKTSKNILQVITVKIVDDLTGTDYFISGSIGPDQRTIFLGKILPSNGLPLIVTYQSTENSETINTQIIRLNRRLPYQNSQVIVDYIPKGLQGDRLSIFKDLIGNMNFSIIASGNNYTISTPIRWVHGTWHRVKVSYKINGGTNSDEMRMFLDGYQFTDLFSQEDLAEAGDGYVSARNIIFRDPINEIYIGTQYSEASPIYSLIDNFRISNISRPIYAPFGEAIDVNFNSNIDMAFPVTSDLYTTYLLNFNSILTKNTDFTVLKNRNTGSFDFSINIIDSLDIVSQNPKSKESLEALIQVLKPATSRSFITYTPTIT